MPKPSALSPPPLSDSLWSLASARPLRLRQSDSTLAPQCLCSASASALCRSAPQPLVSSLTLSESDTGGKYSWIRPCFGDSSSRRQILTPSVSHLVSSSLTALISSHGLSYNPHLISATAADTSMSSATDTSSVPHLLLRLGRFVDSQFCKIYKLKMVPPFCQYLHPISSSSSSKSSIITYLIESLGFSKRRALVLFNRFSSTQTNPQSVVLFLKSIGFTKTDIQSCVNKTPQILFSDAVKTLKPRIQFFQDLGLAGSALSKFLSKNPAYLSNRFEERLKPCVDVIKELMINDHHNEKLIRTLSRCNWVDVKQPVPKISANIKYLEQCGIVGSQLVTIFTRQPRLLIMGESELKHLVSKALNVGFSIDSRMLVHALYTISCLSDETVERKIELFRSFGFTKVEFLDMFKRAPGLLRVSESKLKLGIEFFLNTVKFDKSVLVRQPACLMLSLEERVIPRYKILHLLMLEKLLKKMPKFLNVLWLPEDEFMERFISKNRDDAEKLLLAYKRC